MPYLQAGNTRKARVDNTLAFLVRCAEVVLVPKLVSWQIGLLAIACLSS